MQGRLIRTLSQGTLRQNPGRYRVMWDGLDEWHRAVPAGPYSCRMLAGKYRKAKVMVLLR